MATMSLVAALWLQSCCSVFSAVANCASPVWARVCTFERRHCPGTPASVNRPSHGIICASGLPGQKSTKGVPSRIFEICRLEHANFHELNQLHDDQHTATVWCSVLQCVFMNLSQCGAVWCSVFA